MGQASVRATPMQLGATRRWREMKIQKPSEVSTVRWPFDGRLVEKWTWQFFSS